MRPLLKLATFGLLASACVPSVPGLGPLQTASRPIVPEPAMCGAANPQRVATTPRDVAIKGAADFHNHQFANLGFGGRVLWGKPYDRRGIAEALSACGTTELCWDDREIALCKLGCALASNPDSCREGCRNASCGDSPPHGRFGVTDPVGFALEQGTGHFVHGYPDFRGWPHYNSYTHQQEYYTWLHRAFEGGLKLMVMLAVTNETLCQVLGGDHACDDMTNVDLQLQEAKNLEAYIDWQVDCVPGNHNGWYRIAETSEQARRIIESGAMAVVLGIEADLLFNCRQHSDCTEQSVARKVDWYHQLGVRHVFPVHLMNNAFGGTAAGGDLYALGNVVVNGGLIDVYDCSDQGYGFRFGELSTKLRQGVSFFAERLGVDYPEYPKHGAHCNSRGLEPGLGATTIQALMRAGMLIDVDHMSTSTRRSTLELARSFGYPGVVSGHTGFIAQKKGHARAEGELSESEVDALLARGGLVAPILSQGEREANTIIRRDGTNMVNDCGDSAKLWANAYLYAVDQLRRHERSVVGVGFGSDMNGLAGLPTPRFGDYACGGDGEPQTNRVTYPIDIYGSDKKMYPLQAGTRVFDINVDGFANMGMFPDFVAELRAIGLKDADLEPLFNSAEAYLVFWKAAENWSATARGR